MLLHQTTDSLHKIADALTRVSNSLGDKENDTAVNGQAQSLTRLLLVLRTIQTNVNSIRNADYTLVFEQGTLSGLSSQPLAATHIGDSLSAEHLFLTVPDLLG